MCTTTINCYYYNYLLLVYFCTSIYFLILINIPRTKKKKQSPKQRAQKLPLPRGATDQIERTKLSVDRTPLNLFSIRVEFFIFALNFSVICFPLFKKKNLTCLPKKPLFQKVVCSPRGLRMSCI